MNTPLSQAIQDYISGDKTSKLIIQSDLADDDEMDVNYFFRNENELPEIEKIALNHCKGKILDVGACVGAHTLPLINKGFDVKAIDTEIAAVEYLKQKNVNAVQTDFISLDYSEKFDTILLLMNGIGIAKNLKSFPDFINHCIKLLNPGGKIICDSTDIKYFYEDEEGALWVDLNAEYYGEFKFKWKYKDIEGEEFEWLYLDYEKMKQEVEKLGLSITKIFENEEENHFLTCIKKI